MGVWLGAGAHLSRDAGSPYETADGTVGDVRSFRPLDRIRVTWQPPGWDHDSTVQVTVTGDRAKTTIHFHQERLASAQERERQRDHWRQVLDALAELL